MCAPACPGKRKLFAGADVESFWLLQQQWKRCCTSPRRSPGPCPYSSEHPMGRKCAIKTLWYPQSEVEEGEHM